MNEDIKSQSLVHVRTVNERQVAFGNRVGIDISGKSLGVAKAMIEDVSRSSPLTKSKKHLHVGKLARRWRKLEGVTT